MIVINRRTLPAMTLRRYRRTDPSVEKLPPAVQTAIHTHTLQHVIYVSYASESKCVVCFDLLYFTMLESQCGLKFT